MERFELSEEQANAILEMRLRQLTALSINELREELEALGHSSPNWNRSWRIRPRRREIIKADLIDIREKFGEPRRSQMIPDEGDLSLEDLIADDELIVSVSRSGYVKSVSADTYRSQGRGGRGIKAAEVGAEDVVSHLIYTTAHAYLLFFTNTGKVHRIKTHQIPRQQRTSKGVLAQAVMPLEPEERIEAVIDTRDYETNRYLVMVTKKGQTKKTEFKEYDSRNTTLVAINLNEDDELVAVRTTSGQNDMLLFTRNGQGIRFSEDDLRPMGRATQGVRGIKLREGDEVVAATSNIDGDEVLLVTSGGYGKRTATDQFPRQGRGGIGVKAFKLTKVRGQLIGAKAVEPTTRSSSSRRRERASVPPSRASPDSSGVATGVKVIDVGAGQLATFTIVQEVEVE
jgi:DNA gyrase subunit A